MCLNEGHCLINSLFFRESQMNEHNFDYIQSKNSSEEIENEKEKAKLIDLLNDQRSYRHIAIGIEITKTIHLLVKKGGFRRKEVISHPQVSDETKASDVAISAKL